MRRVGALVSVVLLLSLAPAALAAPPANDGPANATAIPAGTTSASGSNVEAGMDVGEPAPLSVEGSFLDRSVWFAHIADRTAKYLVDTCEANFRNAVHVYQGEVGALTPVSGTESEYQGCSGGRLSYDAVTGVRYLIRITALREGPNPPFGGIFNVALSPQEPAPNDAFARAIQVQDTGVSAVPLAFSTIEFGEPAGSSDSGSVWYRLTPTRTQPFTVQLGSSPFQTTLGVFEAVRPGINGLREIETSFERGEAGAVSFNGLRGRTYYLRVGTGTQVAAPVNMTITTNTASGIGLLATPLANTIASVRRSGLRATLSCARTCRLGADLLVSPRDVRRYRLVKAWRKARRPLRVGHVGGTLQTGVPQTVTVPITTRGVKTKLRSAALVHFILRIHIRGSRGARPLTKVLLVRRRAR